jgi:tetratricopeptide (TPR) repeat protein
MAQEVLRVAPQDPDALQYMQKAEKEKAAPPTPEKFLNASLADYQNGRYEESIRSAKAALAVRPNYAEAYNNIAAANQAMKRWDEAIQAAKEALRLKPDLQIARNNLAYSLSEKAKASAEASKDRNERVRE